MKRALAFTLMVLAIMIIAVSCEEPQAPHEHDYAKDWSYDDTYHWHKATCGDTDEVDGKEAHKFGNLIPDVAATESTTGKGHRVCSVCGYERKEEISALGHSHKLSSGYVSTDPTGHWQTCSGCNSKVNFSAHTIDCVSADDLEHDYKCTVCGYVEDTEDHEMAVTEYETTGKKERWCTKCSYKKSLAAVATTTEKVTSVTKADTSASGVTKITIVDDKGNVSTKEVNNSQIVKNSETVTISAKVVAAADTSSSSTTETTKQTSVSFPEGALKMQEGATEVKLTVTALTAEEATSSDSGYQNKTTDTESDTTSIKVSSDKAVVAGFEFKLSGAVASDLSGKGENGTTVTTYIAKGLAGDKTYSTDSEKRITDATSLKEIVNIQYIGSDGKQPVVNSYRDSDGELVFTVYHFSKYAVIAEKVVATDNEGNMYTSLEDIELNDGETKKGAISSVKTGGTVTLLKNAEIGNLSKPIDIDKNLTINLNNKQLTVKNTGNETTRDNAAAFNIMKDTKVTVTNGLVVGYNGTTFCLKENGANLALEKVNAKLTNDKKKTYWKQTDAGEWITPKVVQLYQNVKTSLTVKDSKLYVEYGAYGIASDASSADAYIKVDIENTTIECNKELDTPALLLNVPGEIKITNSKIIGDSHGAILRGGTHTISNSTFEFKAIYNGRETSDYIQYETGNWDAGASVPQAAIVVGNRNDSYAYPTKVTLNGKNTLTVPENGRHLYVYQNDTSNTVIIDGNADHTEWSVNSDMNGASYFVSTWDGKTADTTWYDNHTGESSYTLTTASQLAGLAELVNRTENAITFEGKTIDLANDIDLSGEQWTPIGLYHGKDDEEITKKPFSGTFDGKGHTISGLKIDNDNGKSSYRALFGYVLNGTVSNFTLNGEVKACDSAGVVGALSGGIISGVTNNVTVTTTKATEDDKPQAKVAGIVVIVKDNDQCESKIENCKNTAKITSSAENGTSAVGGIVAWHMASKLTVSGCENSGTIEAGGTQSAGGIIGLITDASKNTSIKDCKNTGTVKAGTGRIAGDIIGLIYTNAKGSIENCTPANKQIGTGNFTTPEEE